MNTGLQIFVLALLLLMSSFFSATETAFLSINRIRLKSLAERYDELLTAILIGNNLVNIASASLATVLFTQYWGDAGVTLSTVVMTVLVLIFGEVTPKSLAKERPEQFAAFAAPIMSVLTRVLLPFSYLFLALKKGLHKLIPQVDDQERAITEDELMTYVDEAEDDGGIDEHESALIRSAIEFHDRDVEEILTPRVDISAIEDTASVEEIARVYDETGYSRLPVYHGSIDNVVGVLHERDFYSSQIKGEFVLANEVGRVLYVQGGLKISALMRRLQLEKLHMAIVLDEFGGTLGLVTLEDVIEELVGEIWDEHDEEDEEFCQLDSDTYLIDGSAGMDDLCELLDIAAPETDSVSVGGWVMEQLGHIPVEGDEFDYLDLNVRVMEMDHHRVSLIRIKRTPKSE